MAQNQEDISELDWIRLHKDLSESHPPQETQKEKMIRKIKENPLVPVGCLATFSALSYGLWSFRQGRRQMSQMMMRARIVAQGFTVLALILGIAFSANKFRKTP